jgi:hypothetical protein
LLNTYFLWWEHLTFTLKFWDVQCVIISCSIHHTVQLSQKPYSSCLPETLYPLTNVSSFPCPHPPASGNHHLLLLWSPLFQIPHVGENLGYFSLCAVNSVSFEGLTSIPLWVNTTFSVNLSLSLSLSLSLYFSLLEIWGLN